MPIKNCYIRLLMKTCRSVDSIKLRHLMEKNAHKELLHQIADEDMQVCGLHRTKAFNGKECP